MTQENPSFAAAVRMARRALDKEIAARAGELQASIGKGAAPITALTTGLMTPDDPAIAVTITEATRALIAQVAAWAREAQTMTDVVTLADVASTAAPPSQVR